MRNDGTSAYSPILPVSRSVNGLFTQVNLYPNPVIHQLKVSILSKKPSVSQVAIFNASGQRVYNQQSKFVAGYTTIQIPVSHLTNGVYWLMLESGGTQERRKFVKAN